jgi:hypothetical protein
MDVEKVERNEAEVDDGRVRTGAAHNPLRLPAEILITSSSVTSVFQFLFVNITLVRNTVLSCWL